MTLSRWERHAPLTGVLAVVLWVVGAVLLFSNEPESDATPQQYLRFLEDEGPIYGGSWAWGLAVFFFLWFLGSLRKRLAAAEGGIPRLAAIAFAGGIGGAAFALAVMAPTLSGVFAAQEKNFSPDAAQALGSAGEGFFALACFPLLAMAAATALAAFRYRALPAWLGWLTVVLTIALAAYPVAWLVIIFAFPVWLLITSVVLWRLVRFDDVPTSAGPPVVA